MDLNFDELKDKIGIYKTLELKFPDGTTIAIELRGLSWLEINSIYARYEKLKPKQYYKYIFGKSNYERKLKELDDDKMCELVIKSMKTKSIGTLKKQITTLKNSLYSGHLFLMIEEVFKLSGYKI
jgi:hypothetical protein